MQVSNMLKKARENTIHKSGMNDDPNNYRSIYLMLPFRKTLEKIVYVYIYTIMYVHNFLERFGILKNSKFDFR